MCVCVHVCVRELENVQVNNLHIKSTFVIIMKRQIRKTLKDL